MLNKMGKCHFHIWVSFYKKVLIIQFKCDHETSQLISDRTTDLRAACVTLICTSTEVHTFRFSLYGGKVESSPDILVAVDVDSVELMLEVFILYICHVVDHLQNYKTWQH